MRWFQSKREERIGELNILGSAMIFAFFPVIIKLGNTIPPIFYAAVSTLITALLMLVVVSEKGKLHELKNRKAWKAILIVTVFVIVIPYLLIYRGIQMTTGVNASILHQAEIFFALFYGWIIGETLKLQTVIGALLIVAGTLLTLFNGELVFNQGDLLVIMATASYPFANIFAKKALKVISPSSLVLARSVLGGLILLAISFFIEPRELLVKNLSGFWYLFILNGLLVSGYSKILWYRGLQKLEMSKATVLVMPYPAFGVLYATVFLNESPTIYQLLGLMVIIFGIFSVVHEKEVPIHHIH